MESPRGARAHPRPCPVPVPFTASPTEGEATMSCSPPRAADHRVQQPMLDTPTLAQSTEDCAGRPEAAPQQMASDPAVPVTATGAGCSPTTTVSGNHRDSWSLHGGPTAIGGSVVTLDVTHRSSTVRLDDVAGLPGSDSPVGLGTTATDGEQPHRSIEPTASGGGRTDNAPRDTVASFVCANQLPRSCVDASQSWSGVSPNLNHYNTDSNTNQKAKEDQREHASRRDATVPTESLTRGGEESDQTLAQQGSIAFANTSTRAPSSG